MELNGALWNPLGTDKHRLGRLVKLVADSRQRSVREEKSAPSPRIGGVKSAVIRVLEAADEPLSPTEVRRRCEALLGRPVNSSTVKDCVHTNARGSNPLFLRIRHGRYTRA